MVEGYLNIVIDVSLGSSTLENHDWLPPLIRWSGTTTLEKQTLMLIILLMLNTIAIICVFGMTVFLSKLGTLFCITPDVLSVTEASL